jgi:hypothetical protein
MEHAKRDTQQLEWLLRKRRSRKKLNATEDAILAHINARYMAFVSGPEMQGRARLAELKEKEPKFRVAFGRPLTYREQALDASTRRRRWKSVPNFLQSGRLFRLRKSIMMMIGIR